MKEFLAMLKLYSTQVILWLAGLNGLLVMWPDAPAWLVIAVNVAGVIAHHIARKTPQPEVTAEIARIRATA